MPKVSILLTSYNHEKYLHESINSVLAQTYKDFELIIYDDASTDNSWQVINTYEDSRIIAIRSEVNRGGPWEINLLKLSGEYFAIHHSDDVWEPTKLEKQVAFLDQNPDIAAVFTHVQVIDEEGQPFKNEDHFYFKVFDQPNRTRYEWLNFFFYHGNALCHPSMMIRKECFNEVMYRKGLAQIPDFDLWVQLCMKHEIYVIQEKLTRFRVRDNEANMSGDHQNNRIRGQFEFLRVMEHYKNISSTDDLIKIFSEAEKYTNLKNPDILYALGRVAVETGFNNSIKLFGINLLFDAINYPERASKLSQYQLFDQKAFIKLTAENDIFSVDELRDLYIKIKNHDRHIEKLNHVLAERDQSIQQLTSDLAKRDQEIQQLTSDLAEREQEVLFYALSKSWRITRPIRKLRKLIQRKKNER